MKKLLSIMICGIILVACSKSEQPGKGKENSPGSEQAQSVNSESDNGAMTDEPMEKPEFEGKVVAVVNGTPVYDGELRNRRPYEGVTDEILYQYGLSKGLDKKYRQKVYEYEKQLIVRDVTKDIVENLPPSKPVSEEEVEAYYENNKSKYMFMKLEEITFKNKDLSDEILKRAQGGEKLEDIAAGYSDTGQPVTVNDLGYNRELVIKYNLEKNGQVTDVIQKKGGDFSIIKVTETHDIPMSQSKNSIRDILESKNQAKQVHDKARDIAEENNMTIEMKY